MEEGHGNSQCGGASALEFIRRVRLSSELELIQPGEVDTSRLATSRGGATVQGLRHIPGRRLVLEATKFAREGSWSEMETCLWIMLTMPQDYSLYGLQGAKLNSALVPTSSQRCLMRHKTPTPDILWEHERVAIEYQGEVHNNATTKEEDARRLNDYGVCSIRMHFVTFNNVRSIADLNRLVRRIADSMRINGHPESASDATRAAGDFEHRNERARFLAHLLPPLGRNSRLDGRNSRFAQLRHAARQEHGDVKSAGTRCRTLPWSSDHRNGPSERLIGTVPRLGHLLNKKGLPKEPHQRQWRDMRDLNPRPPT